MFVHTSASAVASWGSPRLGLLRFPVFGLAAAAGLVASMAFARRCAARCGLDPEAAWDAGLFATFSCFAASRLLPALTHPALFLRHPSSLLASLLSLPSLTIAGFALAAPLTWAYLRRKRVSVLLALDVFAAPAALLAAFLEFGHWAEASDAGMPTRLPWGVAVPGAPATLRVHPVAVYGALLSAGLALWLCAQLPSTASQDVSGTVNLPGRLAAFGLIAGSFAAFVLDMLSAPAVTELTPWIEPGQWIAVAGMLAGACVWVTLPVRRTPATPLRPPFPDSSPLHMEVH